MLVLVVGVLGFTIVTPGVIASKEPLVPLLSFLERTVGVGFEAHLFLVAGQEPLVSGFSLKEKTVLVGFKGHHGRLLIFSGESSVGKHLLSSRVVQVLAKPNL